MTAVILGREHWYGACARRWNRAWGDEDDATPVICLRAANGNGMWVVVEPSRDIESVWFGSRDKALDHARALEKLHGWNVFDERRQGVI